MSEEDELARQQVILEEVLPDRPGPLTDDAWRLEMSRKLDDIADLLRQLIVLMQREAGSGRLGHN